VTSKNIVDGAWRWPLSGIRGDVAFHRNVELQGKTHSDHGGKIVLPDLLMNDESSGVR
jgi:hypothetical protein